MSEKIKIMAECDRETGEVKVSTHGNILELAVLTASFVQVVADRQAAKSPDAVKKLVCALIQTNIEREEEHTVMIDMNKAKKVMEEGKT